MDFGAGFLRWRQVQLRSAKLPEIHKTDSEDSESAPLQRWSSEGCIEAGGSLPLSGHHARDSKRALAKGSGALPSFANFKLPAALFSLAPDVASAMTSRQWYRQLSDGFRDMLPFYEDKGSLIVEARKMATLDIKLDPTQKIQSFGTRSLSSTFSEKVEDVPKWSKEDTVAFAGLPGRVPMPAYLDHAPVIFTTGFLLCLCGALFASLAFWAPGQWFPVWVAAALATRAAILFLHAVNIWQTMGGSEILQALAYPWLDLCISALILGLHLEGLGHLSTCVASWLIARGVWLEGMALLSSWDDPDRRWWLSMLAVWPPVLAGSCLAAGLPTAAPWLLVSLLGACCLIDGVPAWTSSVSVRFHVMEGDGLLPEHSRSFFKDSTYISTLVHGAMRLTVITLFVLAWFAPK